MASKSNSKVIWYILFALITIVLCYLFTVICFFYITPYNIQAKTIIWPFMNEAQIGQTYDDAVVEIKYNIADEDNFGEPKTISVIGVNVKKDGYIVAPNAGLKECDADENLQIFAHTGEVFDAKILYEDTNYNLAIVKCLSKSGNQVKLPYVKLKNMTDTLEIGEKVVALNVSDGAVRSGKITNTELAVGMDTMLKTDSVVEYVSEYCFATSLSNFSDGPIFDKKGRLLGFYLETNEDQQVFMPADAAKLYLDSVIGAYNSETNYTNKLVNSFTGFDSYEVSFFMDEASKNSEPSKFYFNGEMQDFTDDIYYFANELGFYLFEDFVYNEQIVLAKDNVISKLETSSNSYGIDSRADLFCLLYPLKAGQEVTLYYHEIDTLGAQSSRISFVV